MNNSSLIVWVGLLYFISLHIMKSNFTILLFLSCLFLLFSCGHKEDPVLPEKPVIECGETNYYLKPFSVGEDVTIPFTVSPSGSAVSFRPSFSDIEAALIPGEEEGDYFISLSALSGWSIDRKNKDVYLYIIAENDNRKTEKRIDVHMDIEGAPGIDGFPASLFVYPARASVPTEISFRLINCNRDNFSFDVNADVLDVTPVFDGRDVNLTITPTGKWIEEAYYGDHKGEYLNVVLENDYGRREYGVFIKMPRLDVPSYPVHLPYHGGRKRVQVTSDVPFTCELARVGDPVIPDPSQVAWMENNPVKPAREPSEWLTVGRDGDVLDVEALPAKRPGILEADLVIRDEKGVYERTVRVIQDEGDEYDYIDNITDFEALWLIYESQTKFKTSLENQGWGASEMRNWGGPVRLQRADKVIEFGNGGADCIPPEIGAFDKMTEFVYRPGHGDFNKREGIPGNTIPESMSKCKSLRTLVISYVLTEGDIPSWIGDLSNLSLLNLAASNIGGTVPEWFARLSYVSIKDCRCFGEVPKVVYESAAWKQDDNWTQQDGYLLYYVDESGNKVYPSQEGKSD